MVHNKFRIIFAAISVFAALVGLGVAVHGLVFDSDKPFRYGIGALVVGVAAFVMLLNPSSKDEA
jgi:hypothetical protein